MEFLKSVVNYVPYVAKLHRQTLAADCYPPGHFYSPIRSASELPSQPTRTFHFPKLFLNEESQFELLQSVQTFYAEVPFSKKQTTRTRYYYEQTVFCSGDEIFLYLFLRHVRP